MKLLKNAKNHIACLLIFCIILSLSMPIISYADSDIWKITSGEELIDLSITPYENELGFMIDAEDASKAFGLDYQFDAEEKTFMITTQSKEKIVLSHNATQFKSGDNYYDCQPYFYVENGIPMIELGFFCNMFSSSYEKSNKLIIINKGKLSDDIAKISIDGKETPLYIEPYKTELGLIVGLVDIANAFAIEYSYSETDKSSTLTDKQHGTVILNDKAEKFVSDAGEFECAPKYFVSDDIAFIEMQFFCEMYGASYNYDERTKVLTVQKNAEENNHIEQSAHFAPSDFSPYSTAELSGVVSYSKGAPSNGLDVKLILQQTRTRNVLYKGEVTEAGQTYVLGTVRLNEGEKRKNYNYNVSKYYSSNYPTYSLFYEESNLKEYGYYNLSNSTTPLSASPLYSSTVYSSAKQFSSNSSAQANIALDNHFSISGNISLEDGYKSPEEINVDLILQTRGATYVRNNIYGASTVTYNIGKTVNLGTSTLNKDDSSVYYNYIVSPNYTNNYPYYTLFYSAEDADCVEPYGYYDNSENISTINISPLESDKKLINSMVFNLMNDSSADMQLPFSSTYLPPTSMPIASVQSGSVNKGTAVALSCETKGAEIYYTTDGSIPTTSSNRYNSPIIINSNTVIKAIAVKSGMTNSEIATYIYDIIELNKLNISGAASADIGQKNIVESISFATDKTAKYFVANIKYSSNLILTGLQSDTFDTEAETYEENGQKYLYLTCTYKGGGNMPTNKKLNPVNLIFEISENADVNDILSIEFADGETMLADEKGNNYTFESLGKSEIKINPILAESITINGDEEIDKNTQYTASVFPYNTTKKDIKWSVDNNEIAEISSDGILSPKKAGTVKITATATDGSGVYGEKTVNVKVYAQITSLSSNMGIWDKEFSPSEREYTIYVPKTTTAIRLTATHNGTLKSENKTFISTSPKPISLTENETILTLNYSAPSYSDSTYIVKIVKFEGTKTTVSSGGKTFCIKPINIKNGASVILALYNNGKFVQMKSATNIGGDISFTTDKIYTDAKVMVWNSLDKMTPLCDIEEVE